MRTRSVNRSLLTITDHASASDFSPNKIGSQVDSNDTFRFTSAIIDVMPLAAQKALESLLAAHVYAEDLAVDTWQFAIELNYFIDLGMTRNDLRWMLCKGWLKHAKETSSLSHDARTFQFGEAPSFESCSCFILTDTGVSAAKRLHAAANSNVSCADGYSNPDDDKAQLKPRWDAERNQLYFGEMLVKEFKMPSPNQGTVLMTFEEEGWPPRIDDPLPPSPNVLSKERLRYTIKSLNKHQKRRVVQFMGDGTGEGIRWEPLRTLLSADAVESLNGVTPALINNVENVSARAYECEYNPLLVSAQTVVDVFRFLSFDPMLRASSCLFVQACSNQANDWE